MIEQLCLKIWANQDFQNEYESLSRYSLKHTIRIQNEEIDGALIVRLLQCASHFSLSDQLQHRRASYEIAISCAKLIASIESEINFENATQLIIFILQRLGNFPAADFVHERMERANKSELPTSLWMETEEHKNRNTINIENGKSIVFTDFQSKLWSTLTNEKTITINAPTSAGKSFVLQSYLANFFTEKFGCVAVYLVPTRALISQVISDMNRTAQEHGLILEITEVPAPPSNKENHLFVLTQERFQILLDSYLGSIGILIVDEAQNLSDGSRGILLQSVIETASKRDVDLKLLFGCPNALNPEILPALFGRNDSSEVVSTEESPVLQNLIAIETDPYINNVAYVSRIAKNKRPTDAIKVWFETELVDEDKTVANLAYYFGKNAINIIYGSEPVKCENLAKLLMNIIISDEATANDEELNEFSEFIKEHIHKDFYLVETIKYGVAYHYGKMPSFLRKGIESLAKKGKIKYIVCTSTLLQGINLPAQNIFIAKPTKGKDSENRNVIPLASAEFWNLCGRAGRLTKDYEGNIYLINLDKWLENPINEEKYKAISPAFEDILITETPRIIDYIESRGEYSGGNKELIESAFMKMYIENNENTLTESLEKYKELQLSRAHEIPNLMEKLGQEINIPNEVSKKNPSISVFDQQRMLNYLVKRIAEKGARYVIPPHPLSDYKEISLSYLQLFKRIHTYFERKSSRDNSHNYFYPLAILWMKGLTYHQLLSNKIEYKKTKRKRGVPDANVEARGLFDDIESALRFRYVKFTRCYIDLLKHALESSNNGDYISSIPPIYLFLELGASSKTMISLMSMGITRATSFIISKEAPRSDMDRDSVRGWLSKADIRVFDLPKVLQGELTGSL